MGNGKWTRYGKRGAWCGWGLEIGRALRGNVARAQEGGFRASLNATDLGIWKDEDEAKKAVEDHITRQVQMILEDWALWELTLAAASRSGKNRTL